jgi:hypothetical protein
MQQVSGAGKWGIAIDCGAGAPGRFDCTICAARVVGDRARFKTALFEVTLRTVSVPLSRFRLASTRSDSCSFTRFCRSWWKSQTRGLRRQPGGERLLRSGRKGELDGLFRPPTAYPADTGHTCLAQERDMYGKYGKYVPGVCRAESKGISSHTTCRSTPMRWAGRAKSAKCAERSQFR